jgi:CRP-like cAMP-binding protein
MSGLNSAHPHYGNHLLSLLEPEDFAHLASDLEPVNLPGKQVIAERNRPITHIYFPGSCVLSVLAQMLDGQTVEVGTIGNEGFYGLDVLAGSDAAIETTVCQVPGMALRLPVERFRQRITGDTPLRRLTQRFLQAYMSLVSQSVACNRLHTIEARFARWLLMTHDRVPGDEFDLTQEFLAAMLGTHRPSVSLVAGAFQQAGMIRYNRGHIAILKRQALEEISCECYSVVQKQFNQIFGRLPRKAP